MELNEAKKILNSNGYLLEDVSNKWYEKLSSWFTGTTSDGNEANTGYDSENDEFLIDYGDIGLVIKYENGKYTIANGANGEPIDTVDNINKVICTINDTFKPHYSERKTLSDYVDEYTGYNPFERGFIYNDIVEQLADAEDEDWRRHSGDAAAVVKYMTYDDAEEILGGF